MRQQEVNMKISTEVIIALLASFAISVVLSPIIIPFLKRLKIGQTERTEGVQSHLEKAGTPTMGGLIILISVLVTSLFFIRRYPNIIPVLFLTLGFGIIGFLDDYLKVVLRRSDGLLPKQKMLGQIIVTTIFLAYILIVDKSFLTMRIPFSDQYFDCKWITVPLVYLAVIGTVNGVNFTEWSLYSLLLYPSGLAAALSQSRQRLPVHCSDFCYLTSIRHRYLWEIPDLWHLEDLWQVQPMC